MIPGCEKREDCWMNIGTPDFVREQGYTGYLETRRHGSSDLSAGKKNDMRLLRDNTAKPLRQEGTAHTGSVLRGCADLSGGGGSACPVPEMREGETRETGLAGQQSLLYEEICLICGAEMSNGDRQGCREGTEAGLAYGQSVRQRIHGGATTTQSSSSSPCYRDRRSIVTEGSYLSDRRQRPGERTANLVRRDRPFGRESRYVLRVAWFEEDQEDTPGSHGHVESL